MTAHGLRLALFAGVLSSLVGVALLFLSLAASIVHVALRRRRARVGVPSARAVGWACTAADATMVLGIAALTNGGVVGLHAVAHASLLIGQPEPLAAALTLVWGAVLAVRTIFG